MSVEAESLVHLKCANVDDIKENGSNSTISHDSGIEISDATSATLPSPHDSDISYIKTTENEKIGMVLNVDELHNSALENDGSSDVSTPTSLSSEDKEFNTFEISSKNDDLGNLSDITNYSATDQNDNINETKINNNEIPNIESKDDSLDSVKHSSTLSKTCNLNSETNKTASTYSLNEPNNETTTNLSPLSRSADNISNYDTHNHDLNHLITKDLDQERILSEFLSQKNKVSATQKIVQDNQQMADVKYARLPKEILSQDLGSIVKNVHGIFSSVSGSLKNAYNNTQRVAQKPIAKTVKPVTNGRIMNEIFEFSEEKSVNDIAQLQSENSNLNIEPVPKSDVPELEHEKNDSNNEMLKLQIESLERVLFEQRKENASLRERVKQQCDELQAKDQTFKDLEAKVDLMCKRAEQAQREKDAAVMRYASTECAAIEAKRAAEAATKAERAAIAERELATAKLRTAREEKQRICQLYDDKCHELQNSEREVNKVREEFREIEGRLKWTQSKLRMEMDACKESTERVEKLSQQVAELEAAKEAATVNATDSIRAKQLESDLKESQATLIMCRHEKDDLDRRLTVALQQLDTCKRERDEASGSLALANEQIESLKESNERLEEEAAELAALRARAALADTLEAQLQRETERAWAAEQALSTERARAETCLRREAAALEHAARLTAAHVHERARAAEHEAKAQALAADNTSLRETVQVLQEEAGKLRSALNDEMDRRNKENRVLARKVAELTEEAAEANKKLEYEQGENSVLKKKHASAIKELNRELNRALKRIELLEAKLPQNDVNSTRTGSVSSLSSIDSPHDERVQNGHTDVPDVQPDQRLLVERIVSLQRAAAARSERCEFLQEHCAQLTRELRRKSRVLRAALPALPPAALASRAADQHKSEIAQLGGGAMAAVWGGDPGGMTLELSLEMNKRLQAVLEDTLLKNITLKENIDTLGEEISRLREQAKNNENK
ncbi:coiled-coil domain-containing protein 186 isoform X2 [Vanessa atalanta]|uniref:coiled-coil domain-containing protein 186 isoform X2 n=1 Tax=Vanessa atalanta TaxID=42275 RepID=UPI001FCE0EE2|nr:coiled-coil domain-containing protein 186 isoform X2 [Vanessa atalanta]